ncbi:hypothetical protein D3C80_1779680 [compost metagenome]
MDKNAGNCPIEVGVKHPSATNNPQQIISAIPVMWVKMAPPNLSVRGPNSTRDAEPISGPKNA